MLPRGTVHTATAGAARRHLSDRRALSSPAALIPRRRQGAVELAHERYTGPAPTLSADPSGAPHRGAASGFWSAVGWLLVALAGADAIAVLALSRGETVNAVWFVDRRGRGLRDRLPLLRRLPRRQACSRSTPTRATPAERINDGRDFVPTNRWVVFGHHFAAIAGPGPLIGPTLAAQFGYLPGHALDPRRRRARRRGAGLLHPLRQPAARRPLARPDGEGRDRPGRRLRRAGRRVLDHGHPDRRAGARGRERAAPQPVGHLHRRRDDPDRDADGLVHAGGAPARRDAAPPSSASSCSPSRWSAAAGSTSTRRSAPLFTLNAPAARVVDHRLRLRGLGAAGLAAARAARLPLDLRQARHDRRARASASSSCARTSSCRRSRASSTAPGPIFAGKVFPFCFITIACGAISGFHSLISSGTTPKLLRRGDRRADDRLRRDAARVVRRDHGDDRRRGAASPASTSRSTARPASSAPTRSPRRRRSRSWGFPVTPEQMAHARARDRRAHALRAHRRRAEPRGRHGAHLLARARRHGARALVPLRDHVRGAVHPHDARRRARASAASCCRTCSATSWEPLGRTQLVPERAARRAPSSSARGATSSTRASSTRSAASTSSGRCSASRTSCSPRSRSSVATTFIIRDGPRALRVDDARCRSPGCSRSR